MNYTSNAAQIAPPLASGCPDNQFAQRRKAFNQYLIANRIAPPDLVLFGGRQSLKRWKIVHAEYYPGHGVIVRQQNKRIALIFGGRNDH